MKILEHGVMVDDNFEHSGKVWLRKGYAHITVDGKEVALHRYIVGASDTDIVDHKDRNKLNCISKNLRVATYQQNNANTLSKGYSWNKRARKFQAQIKVDRKNVYLGLFETEEEAQKAYRKAHIKHFGEFSPYKEVL